MKITRAMLKDYRKTKREIPYLEAELALAAGDMASDTVKDYSSGFPHTRVITGVDRQQYDKCRANLEKKREQIRAMDAWIDSIEDDQTRMVFDLYYRKGRTWKSIAASIGYGCNEDYPRIMVRDKHLKRLKIR